MRLLNALVRKYPGIKVTCENDGTNEYITELLDMPMLSPEEIATALAEYDSETILEDMRKEVIRAIKGLRDARMDAVSAGWNVEVYKIYKLFEKCFAPGTENAKQLRVAAIFEYAKTMLQWARTATLQELQAYDPNIDVNFPT